MAIFTRQNVGVLDNVPLDNRSTTTNTAWADEYNSYNGQLVYNHTNGFFEAYATAADYLSGSPTSKQIFSTAVDGIFIASEQFLFMPGRMPYFSIYDNDPSSYNRLDLNYRSLAIIEDMDNKTIVSNRGFAYDWNMILNDPPNGIFVGTNPYNLNQTNKHVIAFGTGLKATSGVKDGAIILGNYNTPDSAGELIFTVGCGTSDQNRKNAFELRQCGPTDFDIKSYVDINMNDNSIISVHDLYTINTHGSNIIEYSSYFCSMSGSNVEIFGDDSAGREALKMMYIKVNTKFPDDVTLDVCEYNNSETTKVATVISDYPLGKIPSNSMAEELLLYEMGSQGNKIKCEIKTNGSTATTDASATIYIDGFGAGW